MKALAVSQTSRRLKPQMLLAMPAAMPVLLETRMFGKVVGRSVGSFVVARVSPATVPALAEGKEVKGFYVLQVALKRKEYDTRNILLLQKLIPQQMVFALQFGEQMQLCVYHTRLQQSEWMPTEEVMISLQGLSLDEVWLNIVAAIGGLDSEAEETIEEQILNREQNEKLLQQIAQLEKRCRAEKQTHKRYELHQEILKLKEQL